MTLDEAEAILGPDAVARIRAHPCPPLTPQQVEQLAARLACCDPVTELPRTA